MNIVIVGGGTAGWLAAFYILKSQPEQTVTVIESSQIGIIGAGEGATHILGSVINGTGFDFGINIKDFMIETDATFKQGTRHKNWNKNGGSYFSPLDLNFLKDPKISDYLALQIINERPIHAISELGMFIDEKISVVKKDASGLSPTTGFSFHFDGHKVGAYFKKQVLAMGGTIVDSTVDNVMQDEHGINSILLKNGQTINGDFFIDCTGFAKVLMKRLDAKWKSYKNHLLLNSALPFFLPYIPPTWPQPLTISHALDAGWSWQLPTLTRWGTGYVFCDEFTTFDKARDEASKYYNYEVEPIKQIKFEPGRMETPWIKNCLVLGLASAFVEPLEATSIHASTIQITKFIEQLKPTRAETCSDSVINKYNTEVGIMYDDIRDFIILHYLGGKDNTPFWKHVSNSNISTDFVKHVLDISKSRMLTASDIPNVENSIGHHSWNQILAGLGFISKDVAKQHLINNIDSIEKEYQEWRANRIAVMQDYKTNEDVVLNGYLIDGV